MPAAKAKPVQTAKKSVSKPKIVHTAKKSANKPKTTATERTVAQAKSAASSARKRDCPTPYPSGSKKARKVTSKTAKQAQGNVVSDSEDDDCDMGQEWGALALQTHPKDYYGWKGEHPLNEWHLHLEALFHKIWLFAHLYAHESSFALAALPREEQKELISSLEGLCVQDRDYEDIVRSLPDPLSDKVPALFLAMFLAKDVVERFFTNPFWYFGGDPVGGSEEAHTVLGRMYMEFMRVEENDAHVWRCLTARLSNTLGKTQGDPPFGNELMMRRESLVKRMVSETLQYNIAQFLLGPTEEEAEREMHLVKIYESAAQLAVDITCYTPYLSFQTLEDLEPNFTEASAHQKAFSLHNLAAGDTRLDGHRIIAIMHPFIWRTGMKNDGGNLKPMGKVQCIIQESLGGE